MKISRWVRASTLMVGFLLVGFGRGQPSSADTVYLKNNERLEGRVTKETEKDITLDFGFGTTVIEREKIIKIEKGPFPPAKEGETPAKGTAKPGAPTTPGTKTSATAATSPPATAKPTSAKPAEDKKTAKDASAKQNTPRRIGAAAQDVMPLEGETKKK